MTSVTISRDAREALYDELKLELSGALGDIASSLKHGHGEKVRDLRENAERAFRLLDDLGWDRDDDRSVYRLTMRADELAIYARWRIEQTEGCLRDYSREFAEIAAGGDPWAGPEGKYVAGLWALADRDLDVIGACRSILAQLQKLT